MKKKDLFPLFALCPVVSSCVMDGEVTIFGWFAIVFVIGIIILIIIEIDRREGEAQKQEEWRKKMAEEEERNKSEREFRKWQYEAQLRHHEEKHGIADKTIVLAESHLDREIRVHLSTREVVIFGKPYSFDKIISCSVTDNSTVVHGKTHVTTTGTSKASTGGVIGRGLAGGLIAGPAGAVIGGTTGKRDTSSTSVVRQENDRVAHDYTVWISVRDIVSPLVEIRIGDDERKAKEISSLMDAIIAENNEQ